MQGKQIFEDVSGRRKSLLQVSLLIGFAVLAASLTVFVVSLGVTALRHPGKVVRHLAQTQLDRDRQLAQYELGKLKKRLTASHRSSSIKQPPVSKGPIVLAYYAPWESAGWSSFKAHAPELTHLAPAWFHLASSGLSLDSSDYDTDPKASSILAIAHQKGVRVIPILSNAEDSLFSRQRAAKFLRSASAQTEMLGQLADLAKKQGFAGYHFDFEDLDDSDYQPYAAFLKRAHELLAPQGLEISLAAQTTVESPILKQWAAYADFVAFMTYDEHSEDGAAGPIASLPWFEQQLDGGLESIPADKLVVGIGSYAYDWQVGKIGAEAISYQEAMADAAGYNDEQPISSVISLDPDELNTKFTYEDDDGKSHIVWMLDAISAYNQMAIARKRSIRGAAIWALGTEDPEIWKVVGKSAISRTPDINALESINYPFEVNYSGKGEVLKVISRPSNGFRKLTLDTSSGMIDSVTYESYPTTYVIRKSGYQQNKVVLTFDDGPDPEWTPQILDILKQKEAPGVFFVVGQNVESNPGIINRMVKDGQEVGSHTFTHPNLALATSGRTDVELTATQRVIEAVAGRSTVLFRPPYNADSQPESADEVRSIDEADALGYLTIGENVDPNDWAPRIPLPDGTSRPRTADDIVRLVLTDLNARRGTGEEGNIILLHDAGGDRAQTVKALPRLIDSLRKEGYEIVSLSTLLNIPAAKLMPPIPERDLGIVKVDRFVFEIWHIVQVVLYWGFVIALLLGTARVFAVTPLAIWQAKRKARLGMPAAGTAHPVSVVIAAYNEEKTIVSTIGSVLKSDYPIAEVIVVDDGSTDQTSESIRSAFGSNDMVRLVSKPNGGKASALNEGIALASGDLLFSIDADTRLDPRAIGLLAAHFKDPNVAAAAGNVQVGNVVNLLTAWQDVEYRTSQNLDRRAYEAINGITVIPGAIGMWRKEAIQKAGGYTSDTLAEDMDLTWRLRRLNYRSVTEPEAHAWTEAPESWSALFKQRFRWAYGTTQCLWKHRSAIGRHGWFGKFVLPAMVLFQIVFQILGPFVDLQLLFTLIHSLLPVLNGGSKELGSSLMSGPFLLALQLYALFFLLEFVSGLIAYRMDKAKPWPLIWLLVQRFAYRQLMYLVMLKSIWRALTGARQGWGKLKRTGKAASA